MTLRISGGYVVFLRAHCAYGQVGLRRRLIVRIHKMLYTLCSPTLGSERELTCVLAVHIAIEVAAAARADDVGDLIRHSPVVGKL